MINVSSEIIGSSVQYLGGSFVGPMGADDHEGEFERYIKKMNFNANRVRIYTGDIRPGHVAFDLSDNPLEDPQELQGGAEWDSHVSWADNIDSLRRLGMVPYINVWERKKDPVIAGRPQKVKAYAREIAQFCWDKWGEETLNWFWALYNEPFLAGMDPEEYTKDFWAWKDGLGNVFGPNLKLVGPDVQSDKVRGSSMREVIREIGGDLYGVSIHGLYNEGNPEKHWHYDNVQYVRNELAFQGEIFHTEWFPRREDMDGIDNALSVGAAFMWQCLAGVHTSLMFGLGEGLYWNRPNRWNPEWHNWYGALRIKNRKFTIERPNKAYHVLHRLAKWLAKGGILQVEGIREGVIMAARLQDREDKPATTLCVLNRGETFSEIVSFNGPEVNKPLAIRRTSRHENDVRILKSSYTRPFQVEFLKDSLTAIAVGHVGDPVED